MKPYTELSSFIRGKIDAFLESLVPTGFPMDEILGGSTSTRGIIRAAEGLLYRNNPGDESKAIEIIRWVLSQQFKKRFHLITGSWKTSPVNSRLDSNWREFIGCELIIIYENYKERLPEKLLELMKLGLIMAALNSKSRNVTPYYTNIATMSAFLMDYVGRKFQYPALTRLGIRKATQIFNIYFRNHTFSEFNSPTYAGTTCLAFNLWKKYGSAKFQKLGVIMEAETWEQTASFYNFNLKNICGPYFRGYGMDMLNYSAIIGLWMGIVLDNQEIMPYPQEKDEKYFEISNIIPIVHLDPHVPKKVIREFSEFSSERFLEGTIINRNELFSPRKRFNAMITKKWMIGGLMRDLRNWNQRKIGTMHWKIDSSNKIGWLLVPGDGKGDVTVTKTNMSIFAKLFTKSIRIFVQAPNLKKEMFTERQWKLPGITLRIYPHKSKISIRKIENNAQFRKQWAIADEVDTVFEIKCNFKRKPLRQQAITLEPMSE